MPKATPARKHKSTSVREKRKWTISKRNTAVGFYNNPDKTQMKKVFTSTMPTFRHINKAADMEFIKEFASKQNLVCKIISSTLQKISTDNETIILKDKVNQMKSKTVSACVSSRSSNFESVPSIPTVRKNIILGPQLSIPIYMNAADSTDPATPKTSRYEASKTQAIPKKAPLYMHEMDPYILPSHNKYEHFTFESLNMLSEIREKSETQRRRFKFKY
jgi:hypothetical protein